MSYDVILNQLYAKDNLTTVSGSGLTKNQQETSHDILAMNVSDVAGSSNSNRGGAGEHSRSTSNSSTPRKTSSSRFTIPFTSNFISKEKESSSINAGTAAASETSCNVNSHGTKLQNADETFPEIKTKVESKLMSMWQNVKYGKFQLCMIVLLLLYSVIYIYIL